MRTVRYGRAFHPPREEGREGTQAGLIPIFFHHVPRFGHLRLYISTCVSLSAVHQIGRYVSKAESYVYVYLYKVHPIALFIPSPLFTTTFAVINSNRAEGGITSIT